MNDWVHGLALPWMALVVFGGTYLATAGIYGLVLRFATLERARAFKAVSPGMLPPLGILFGLFVAFTAGQVWGDGERATSAVNREASALGAIVVLAASFPDARAVQLRSLVRSYIEDVANREWAMMGQGAATLRSIPPALAEVLKVTLALAPDNEGQKIAQHEIVTALQNVLDARRQRILVSQSQVNLLKWLCLFVQAACALVAIAMVHSDNRLAAAISMTLFATGVATSILLITSHDRPFTGTVSISSEPLLQVMPEAGG